MRVEKRVVLTKEMELRKNQGYKYVVTYNNTDELFTYKDKYYKTLKGAEKFYQSLNCELKNIFEL